MPGADGWYRDIRANMEQTWRRSFARAADTFRNIPPQLACTRAGRVPVPDVAPGIGRNHHHHRPPALTMRLAGCLIVLEHGHVAQTGAYHQLTHDPGPFARVIRQSLAI